MTEYKLTEREKEEISKLSIEGMREYLAEYARYFSPFFHVLDIGLCERERSYKPLNEGE